MFSSWVLLELHLLLFCTWELKTKYELVKKEIVMMAVTQIGGCVSGNTAKEQLLVDGHDSCVTE